MAKLDIKGIEEYTQKLERTGKNSQKIIRKAIYKGAKIAADSVKQGLFELPIQETKTGKPPYLKKGKLKGITRRQKEDLIKGMGLAPFQEFKLGYVNTKLGFDGYGSVPTKKYPKGLPNALLMRSIESGTSFRQKNPVVRKNINRVRSGVQKAMAQVIEEEIRKGM